VGLPIQGDKHNALGYPPKPGQGVKPMAWIALICMQG